MYHRGVYIIKNLFNKRCYIGSSNCIELRIENHFQLLQENKHYNKSLQKDFNNYSAYFIYGIVKDFDYNIPREEIYNFEQEVLDKIVNKYNVLLGAKDHLEGIWKTNNMKKQTQLKINFEKYGGK